MPVDVEEVEPDVLVLAPLGRDARSIEGLLASRQRPVYICKDIADLTERIGPLTALVIITEEALARGTPEELFGKLKSQPPWSDLPFIYLKATSRGLALPSRLNPRCPGDSVTAWCSSDRSGPSRC